MTNDTTKKAATSAANTWMTRVTGSQRLIWTPPNITAGCENWEKDAEVAEGRPGGLVIQGRAARIATMEETKESPSPVIENFLKNNTRWRVENKG